MGHRPDSRLLSGGTHFAPCATPLLLLLIKWTLTEWRVDTERSWKRKLPYCFFISVHTSNKDIHHTRSHPPPHHLLLLCVASLPVTGNHLKVQERRKKNRDALPFKDSGTRVRLWALTLTPLPVLTTNGRIQEWLIPPCSYIYPPTSYLCPPHPPRR